ncbi:MAG TPA: DUF1569 domain-containing protein [Thermoanaerobaculia bacterium]|jgi:hypothetical protein
MKTLFDKASRQSLLDRAARLTPEAKAGWGKMNAEQMLAHLVEALKLGTGEVTTKPRKMLIRYPPLKQLIIYVLPFPKGAPTAPELKRRESDAGTLARNRAELARLLEDIGGRAGQKVWPEHPAFGKLSPRAWGVLGYRHADHHLRQFGV